MSDVSQGPGWWLASDGKWYSPEQHPGADSLPATESGGSGPDSGGYLPSAGPSVGPSSDYAPPAAPAYPTPAYSPPGYGPPGYGSSSYGSSAYGQPGYGYGYGSGYGSPFPAPVKMNGLAVASLVCSLLWVFGVGAVLAIIFGFVARGQIKRSPDPQQGSGLALAGIIVGICGLVGGVLGIVLLAAAVHHCDQVGNCTFTTTT